MPESRCSTPTARLDCFCIPLSSPLQIGHICDEAWERARKQLAKKQPISQLEHSIASSFFFAPFTGQRSRDTEQEKGGRDVNIWGLLETEGVPSCSPDLRRARDRTMGMTVLLSHALG